MSAKDWINYINETEDSQYSVYDSNIVLMERYANYKNKELYIKIFEFRNMLKHFSSQENSEAEMCEYLLYQFDKDFNIEKL